MESPQELEPTEAVQHYLGDRFGESPGWSERWDGLRQKKHLKFFLDWCEKSDISDISTLSRKDIERYRRWRKKVIERREGGHDDVRLQASLNILRVALEHFDGNLHGTEVLSSE